MFSWRFSLAWLLMVLVILLLLLLLFVVLVVVVVVVAVVVVIVVVVVVVLMLLLMLMLVPVGSAEIVCAPWLGPKGGPLSSLLPLVATVVGGELLPLRPRLTSWSVSLSLSTDWAGLASQLGNCFCCSADGRCWSRMAVGAPHALTRRLLALGPARAGAVLLLLLLLSEEFRSCCGWFACC